MHKPLLASISIRDSALNAIILPTTIITLCVILHLLTPLHSLQSTPPYSTLAYDRAFVALSVDDFGRWTDSVPLFPDTHFMQRHSALMIHNNFWYRCATVETHADLDRLRQSLQRLNANASFEQRAVLTPHWIVGGPDFYAMRSAGCGQPRNESSPLVNRRGRRRVSPLWFAQLRRDIVRHGEEPREEHRSQMKQGRFDTCVYRERLLSDARPTGLDQSPYRRGDLRRAYKELWTEGLWHPEYHGRSHFSVNKWLHLLKTDIKAQACFKNNLVCAADTALLRSEFNDFANKAALKTWLQDGVNAFSSFWGYRPALISSPHNTWSSWLTDTVVDLSFIGAELAEDQANYVQHGKALSLHDRYRFDVFFPGFDCNKAISEVLELVHVPVDKSLLDLWYDFLSMIDLFRVHHRPFHHGIGGNHERYVSLMWHAQNAMNSTYSAREHSRHMECLEKVVGAIREQRPRAVFVTGSELHQIRSKGWSREIWSDSIVFRNYGIRSVDVEIPDIRDLLAKSQSWRRRKILVTTLSLRGENMYDGKEEGGAAEKAVAVGERLRLESDSVVRLTSG